MRRFELKTLSKCEDCDHRRNSTNPHLANPSGGDTIRCYFNVDSERLAMAVEETDHCDKCHVPHISIKVINEYKGDFPGWCPLMERSDLIATVNNLE